MTKSQQSKRIYYISKRPFVADYMTKVKFVRRFKMKSASTKKNLPTATQKAVDELMNYGCAIEYAIN